MGELFMMGIFYILNQDKWTGWEGTVVLQEYLITDDKEDHCVWTLKTYFYGVLGNFARDFLGLPWMETGSLRKENEVA